MSRLFLLGLASLLVTVCLLAISVAGEISTERTADGVAVKIDGKLFTEYLTKSGAKPVLWPVIGPTGVPMTRAYPMSEGPADEKKDHIHQRSLWFTHGSVNGVDFWSEMPGHGSINHREFVQISPAEQSVADQATIETINDWVGPDGKKQCEDVRKLVFQSGEDWRSIDFNITFKATEGPLTFGDTKEGSMGVRVPTVMDVDTGKGGRIVNSEGLTDKDAWGKPAAWVDYHGPVEGEVVGIAILNHPSSFRYPTHWHVRTYGLFAANPFGLHDFTGSADVNGSHTVNTGETLTLRYRIVFHKGTDEGAKLGEAFQRYAGED